jgi:hypothetical protein
VEKPSQREDGLSEKADPGDIAERADYAPRMLSGRLMSGTPGHVVTKLSGGSQRPWRSGLTLTGMRP